MRSTAMTPALDSEFPAIEIDHETDRLGNQGSVNTPAGTAVRLAEAVARAMRGTGYPALRDIGIDSDRGVVRLQGCVPSYHQKQLAQATAQRVTGVRAIDNRIEVICCR